MESSSPNEKKSGKKQKVKKVETRKPQADANAPVKTKAELKAERRAKQEAQRAAKEAAGLQKPQQKQQSSNQKINDPQSQNAKQKKENQASNIRVHDNVKMDDEKVQKKITKQLAKQNVPQRSLTQKKVKLFAHLKQYEKDHLLTKDISFTAGTIHPAIVKLGLQNAAGIITGSNARCIALLCAFKEVIKDYVTPPSKELSRDLESRIIPCISFLEQCRHLSVSMGNAIKFLKLQITQSPIDKTDEEAKDLIIQNIDDFINERIILAGKAISNFAFSKINNGDKILVYGFSSLIIHILKDAKNDGKQFEVIVVDSRPGYQGRESIKRLVACDIHCSYVLINACSYIMKEVNSVFLGAYSLLANGNVMASTGSAMVAMVAKSYNVPVLVCCESYKFTVRVQTDSFVFNELGDPDTLVHLNKADKPDILTGWRKMKSLYMLNLMFDVTPSHFVDMVITELGMIPCTSVPVILRLKNTET